jgi:hypothetical protein
MFDLRCVKSKKHRRSLILTPLTDRGVEWMTQFGAPADGWRKNGVGVLIPDDLLPKVIAVAEHEGLKVERPFDRKEFEKRARRDIEAMLENTEWRRLENGSMGLFPKKTH